MTDASILTGRVGVAVHMNDNVATVLDTQVSLTSLSDGRPIDPGVPFGHKFALVDIRQGEAVIKYGVVIGHASKAIRQGEHVHVHNVR